MACLIAYNLGRLPGFLGKSASADRAASWLRWLLKLPPRLAAATVATLACLPVQSLPQTNQDQQEGGNFAASTARGARICYENLEDSGARKGRVVLGIMMRHSLFWEWLIPMRIS